ncbi:MAG TPA: ABC transporter permease [Steroidobacteraceae bacterium]|nr:ABC transporter permease [Steroidobacteraceae bacterium]
MSFLKQTLALTASGVRGIPQRRGSSFVTVIGVTTVVGVLTSLLSIRDGATIFTGGDSPKDQAVVLSRGANGAPQSALPREAVSIIESAPGVKHTPDGRPYSVFTTMVPVDAIRRDGKRGNVYLVGFTPGTEIVQTPVKLVAGRMYKPAVHELIVSEPIRKMYKNMEIGSRIVLRGTEWTVVGVFAGSDSLGDSVLRADCETVMSAFGRNTFQQGLVTLESPAAYQAFKDAITSNPAVTMDVKTVEQNMKDNFGQLTALLSFVSYFVGTVMASGAIFGALNSLYASVDARRREIATLRAIGFSSGPIIVSVLIEGMLLALPGAFLGALVAWALFNGNVVDVQGLIFKLTVTPHLLVVSIFWALFIGLIGGSLPALRAARLPVATALRAT